MVPSSEKLRTALIWSCCFPYQSTCLLLLVLFGFFLIEYFFLPVSLFSADVLKIHFSPLYLDLGGQDGYFPAPRAPGTQPRVGGERTGD